MLSARSHHYKSRLLLVALAIQNAMIPRQRGAYCQTSTGSPVTADITNVIEELKGYAPDGLCPQTNPEARDCLMSSSTHWPLLQSAAEGTLGALKPTAKSSAQYQTQMNGRTVHYKSELEGGGHQLQRYLKGFRELCVVTAAGRYLLLYF